MEPEEMFEIEKKWQKAWDKLHLFEPTPDRREKYFATYPYSYMNGLPHLGHAFTCLRVDFTSRYKRMRGYNVLFPFAFHCTGLPIVAAAGRIRDGEVKQLQIMRDMGIGEELIHRFADPVYWTEYFPKRWESIMRRLGMSIDWRRQFITTSLNPTYDSFVKWQFTKLKEKEFVREGSHPVIWCPKDNIPVGDHDRLRGEGETPTEYTLIKFKLADDLFLLAATLRPETAFGQTNIWINPETTYDVARVGKERWLLSHEALLKLSEQGYELIEDSTLSGLDIVGRSAYSYTMRKELPILPADFAVPTKGTGIVSSVPSDSPDDYIALSDLKKEAKSGKQSREFASAVLSIEPVEIIETPGYGRVPARKAIEKYKIKSQEEKEKLDKAREEVYREGFYNGVMVKELPEIGGMPVEKAREKIKSAMLAEGRALLMYEPSGEVVCRCLTTCIVKIVQNQWFLAYGDEGWKALAHEATAEMTFYPPFLKKQFDNVIDWLKDWACVHHTGLGTSLPWAGGWKIESLSDSTLYMAYYTISHRLGRSRFAGRALPDAFYDFVFLGKGEGGKIATMAGTSLEEVESMRKEFLYWYPMDVRISGKDLVGNHLTFSIFNHAAIFNKDLWPKAYGVNGWITISGSKMSKSKGNSLMLHEAIEKYGADVTRLTEAYAGEGFDDPNWDEDFAEAGLKKLTQMTEAVKSLWRAAERGEDDVDRWLRSTIGRLYLDYLSNMDELQFKSAVKIALIDMQNALKWYVRRCDGNLNGAATREFAMLQLLMMTPFVPHTCEEVWHSLGHEGSICTEQFPESESYESDEGALLREEYLEDVMKDVDEIVSVTGISPVRIYIYTADKWMRDLLRFEISGSKDGKQRAEITSGVSKGQVEKFYRKLAMEKGQGKVQLRESISRQFNEKEFLDSSRPFLQKELKAEIVIQRSGQEDMHDPGRRSENAFPGRPAIYVT